ncbi:hypothetical protein EI982_09495 [Haloplanus rallus]|uniref:Uncharacterized protein n=1 Tax=Haloplanus rallus TaxID=1816183 RepID=A0A6B9F3X6_9EURY|nr:hypothetical protein [Haloplanus rallus]QGX95008.1 hypothetical protein EI982_09495 [Haloplanus rallus]
MPAGVPYSTHFGLSAGRAIAEAIGDGRSPLEADIPSEVGGVGNVIWDTVYDQPEYADDVVDVPGPTVGDGVDDVTSGESQNPLRNISVNLRNIGPDWLDEAAIVVVVLAVVAVGLWLVRPLLSIGAGVAE